MRAKTRKRRRELAMLKFRGASLENVVQKLASKYDNEPSTIKHDWYNRKEWIGEVFDLDLDDADLLVLDLISEQKEVKRELWRMSRDTPNENIKLGALKHVKDINKELLDMLQSIGVIEKQAHQFELTGEDGGPLEITTLAKKADEWDESE